MRCEDCRAVIEEYFDGELAAETAALVAAHLPACAACAAAIEALEAEQSIYLRYDRGLEVTPALWAGVRAEIARTAAAPSPGRAPAPSPLERLRAILAAAFGALAHRPALASSLALLVVGLAVGSLFFKSSDNRPADPQQIAAGGVRAARSAAPAPQLETKGAAADSVVATPPAAERESASTDEAGDGPESLNAAARRSSRAGGATPGAPPPGLGSLGAPPAVAAAGPVDAPPDPDHLEIAGGDLLPLVRTASLETEDAEEVAAGAARLLAPEEKEVARHVERAQMLLRSFRNTRAAERTQAEVSYEKELSRRLLEENVALRAEAEATGDKATSRVLDAIQPFLLDIANMREKPSRQDVRSIKERMRKTEIVAALQVY
jgi:hypothetical protein